MTKPGRSNDEVNSLTAHRYRNWGQRVKAELGVIDHARQEMEAATSRLAYAYLEAREEQEKLIAAGFTRDQVDSIFKLPIVPVDATSIIRNLG